MSNDLILQFKTILVGKAKVNLQDFQLREDILLDDVTLQGGDIRIEVPKSASDAPHIQTGEVKVTAMMSEPNINRLVHANTPKEVPVKNLQIQMLSGRAKVSGQVVKFIPIPFSLEAVPVIENGVRVKFNLQPTSGSGGTPKAIIDVIEPFVKEYLDIDLTQLPFPFWLDEIRCEPGRVTVLGKAKITFPRASNRK